MIISERIFKILKEKHMSQSAFARGVGLAGSTISDWKTKKTNPSADKIMDICAVLGVTPEQLLTGKGIDEDYRPSEKKKKCDEFVISRADMHLLLEYQSLQEAQKKRLLKYVKALKEVEELEKLK